MKKPTPRVTLIADLQFGSSSKGSIADYIAINDPPDVVVTAWTPSAGHTSITPEGRTFIHTMLANGIVSPKLRKVLLGPGSIINLESLQKEMLGAIDVLNERNAEILVHPRAVVIQQRHRDEESDSMTSIGSTKKGGGAALVEKIRRNGDKNRNELIASDPGNLLAIAGVTEATGVLVRVVTHSEYQYHLASAEHILIEGAQGYSLGINSGFWPYCTSRECTPAQIMSDCAVPLPFLNRVIGTMRTFPIRVSNRYNEAGEMIGYSGPGYDDQIELTFDQIGQIQELTTVTQLPRRVFSFSLEQTQQALEHCRPTDIYLTFTNYLKSEEELKDLISSINKVADRVGCGRVNFINVGPRRDQVLKIVDDSQLELL